MSVGLERLAQRVLDVLLGSGRALPATERVLPRPQDAYFAAFTARCMALVYGRDAPEPRPDARGALGGVDDDG